MFVVLRMKTQERYTETFFVFETVLHADYMPSNVELSPKDLCS